MPLSSGKHTAAFGHWLTQHLPGHTVYDDQGDSLVEEKVAAIHGFYGREVNNVTRLAEVDVLVASPAGETLLVIEIEEDFVSPKKLLGDLNGSDAGNVLIAYPAQVDARESAPSLQ